LITFRNKTTFRKSCAKTKQLLETTFRKSCAKTKQLLETTFRKSCAKIQKQLLEKVVQKHRNHF